MLRRLPCPLALALAVALAAGVSACGGGGGSGGSTTATGAARSAPGPRPGAARAVRARPGPPVDPRRVHADEAGRIPVLEYHRVGGTHRYGEQYRISTAELRHQLEVLYRERYRPIDFRDLVENRIDVPAGTTPVVLTFDDSSDSQFTLVRRHGALVPDPNGAVGVLLAFHRRHPDWRLRGTFFVLPEANYPNHLFDQPKLTTRKLRFLVDQGFEVAGHTLYHDDLAKAPAKEIEEQQARSLLEIGQHLPGYRVRTMAVPFGAYPRDPRLVRLIRAGSWHGHRYRFEAVADAFGGPSPPPGDRRLDLLRVPRMTIGSGPSEARAELAVLVRRRFEAYVSDGDPDTVSFPRRAGRRLDRAKLRRAGKRVRAY